MKPLKIDFSSQQKQRASQTALIGLILLAALLLAVLWQQNKIQTQIVQLEEAIAHSKGHRRSQRAQPSEQDLRKLVLAKSVQAKLNVTWFDLLAALERVKQQLPEINFVSVLPNSDNGKLIISAEAADVEQMLLLITHMQNQAVFHNVLLMNQRQIDTGKKGVVFSLNMEWQS